MQRVATNRVVTERFETMAKQCCTFSRKHPAQSNFLDLSSRLGSGFVDQSQKLPVAMRAMAAEHLSYRVPTRRQSFRGLNMVSIGLRCLKRHLSYLTAAFLDFRRDAGDGPLFLRSAADPDSVAATIRQQPLGVAKQALAYPVRRRTPPGLRSQVTSAAFLGCNPRPRRRSRPVHGQGS